MCIPRLAWGIVALLFLGSGAAAGNAPGNNPVKLLHGHDFAGGGYTVLAQVWGPARHEIQRELGEFYIDDPGLLEELKALWITGGPTPMYACGYHYTILVLRGQRIVDGFSVNLETECGTVVTDGSSYRFDPVLLTQPAARYRTPVVERRTFDSLAEGRERLAALAGNERLLLRPEPEWREYDGEFRFRADCPEHSFNSFNSAILQACLSRVRSEIGAKYPGMPFDVAEAGSDSGGYILIEMKCRKALHGRFDMYGDYDEWRDYEPTVTFYWKEAE